MWSLIKKIRKQITRYREIKKYDRELCEVFDAWEAATEEYKFYKLTFSLEYSSVIDWVADITPGRNHPKARQYGECWVGQGMNPIIAMQRVLVAMDTELSAQKPTKQDKDYLAAIRKVKESLKS